MNLMRWEAEPKLPLVTIAVKTNPRHNRNHFGEADRF